MQNLLQQPKASLVKSIGRVMDAIDVTAPIPPSHKRSLPHDIRDLSLLLTEERGAMGRPYWATKNFFSAYIHYFLPWNLYRLGWLLPSLPMRLKSGSVIVDLGSGPLTLPLALWCARPDLRDIPLRFICTDMASQPMEQGLAIFSSLTKGTSLWKIECVKAPIETAIAKLSGTVDCIMGANVLNELQPAKGQTLNDRISSIVYACSRKLTTKGTIFFVEPGTRLGGKVIIMAREAGRMLGLPVMAPCSHQERCPLAKNIEGEAWTEGRQRPAGRQLASQANMWCHFSFPVEGAPTRLSRLTAAAKFDRRSLALSCVMMSAGAMEVSAKEAALLGELDELEALYAETVMADSQAGVDVTGKKGSSFKGMIHRDRREGQSTPADVSSGACQAEGLPKPPLWARIISGPIRLPKEPLPARYGCSAAGLALVRRCERIPYGAAVEVTWDRVRRDEKSGALLVDMVESRQNPENTEVPGAKGTWGKEARAGRVARGTLSGRKKNREKVPLGRFFRDDQRSSREESRQAGPKGPDKGNWPNREVGEPGRKSRQVRSGRRGQIEGQTGGRSSQKPVQDLQNYFSRPQKMRERYGGLPQSLSQGEGRKAETGMVADKEKGKRRVLNSPTANAPGSSHVSQRDRSRTKRSPQAHATTAPQTSISARVNLSDGNTTLRNDVGNGHAHNRGKEATKDRGRPVDDE